MNSWLEKNAIEMYSTRNGRNLKDLLKPERTKLTSI